MTNFPFHVVGNAVKKVASGISIVLAFFWTTVKAVPVSSHPVSESNLSKKVLLYALKPPSKMIVE